MEFLKIYNNYRNNLKNNKKILKICLYIHNKKFASKCNDSYQWYVKWLIILSKYKKISLKLVVRLERFSKLEYISNIFNKS